MENQEWSNDRHYNNQIGGQPNKLYDKQGYDNYKTKGKKTGGVKGKRNEFGDNNNYRQNQDPKFSKNQNPTKNQSIGYPSNSNPNLIIAPNLTGQNIVQNNNNITTNNQERIGFNNKNEFMGNFNNDNSPQEHTSNPINLVNTSSQPILNQNYQVRNNNKNYKYNNYNNFQNVQGNPSLPRNQLNPGQGPVQGNINNQINQNPNYTSQRPQGPQGPQGAINNGYINKNNLTINNNTYQNITTFFTPNTGNQNFNSNYSGTNGNNKFSNNSTSRSNTNNFNNTGIDFDSEPSHFSMNESLNEEILNLSQSLSTNDKDVGNSNISVLEKSKDKKNFKNIQETLKSNTHNKPEKQVVPNQVAIPNKSNPLIIQKIDDHSINNSINISNISQIQNFEDTSDKITNPQLKDYSGAQLNSNVIESGYVPNNIPNNNNNNNYIYPHFNNYQNSYQRGDQNSNYPYPHSNIQGNYPQKINNDMYGNNNYHPNFFNQQPFYNNMPMFNPNNMVDQQNYGYNNQGNLYFGGNDNFQKPGMQGGMRNNITRSLNQSNNNLNPLIPKTVSSGQLNQNQNPNNISNISITPNMSQSVNVNNQYPNQFINQNINNPNFNQFQDNKKFNPQNKNQNPIFYNNPININNNINNVNNMGNISNYDNKNIKNINANINPNVNNNIAFNPNRNTNINNSANFIKNTNNNLPNNIPNNNFNNSSNINNVKRNTHDNILNSMTIAPTHFQPNKIKKVKSDNDILIHYADNDSMNSSNSINAQQQMSNFGQKATLPYEGMMRMNIAPKGTNNQWSNTYFNSNISNVENDYTRFQNQNQYEVNKNKDNEMNNLKNNLVDGTPNFANFYIQSDQAQTESTKSNISNVSNQPVQNVLTINIKLKNSVKQIQLQVNDDVQKVVMNLIQQNNLSPELIKPIYDKINTAIMSIKEFFCQQITSNDKKYLNYLNDIHENMNHDKIEEYERRCITDEDQDEDELGKDLEGKEVLQEELIWKTI